MDGKVKLKLQILLLIVITCIMLLLSSNVQATTIEENDVTEEKIMKYDAITGETTEVNIEELQQVLANSYNENSIYTLEGYNPNELMYTPKIITNSVTPYIYRVPKENSLGFPYKVTCRITANLASKPGEYIGTASLVGNNLALTSAHCVWNTETKEKYTEWNIYPGYNIGELEGYEGLSCGWSSVYYSNLWMNDPNAGCENDWALCILEKDIGSYLGYHGVQTYAVPTISLNGMEERIIGYPSNIIMDNNQPSDGSQQFESLGNVTGVSSLSFTYNNITNYGMSGAPVLNPDNYIVGVHSEGMTVDNEEQSNIGRAWMVTSDVANLIRSLRNEN